LSQWGHDFRPDYQFLGVMKTQFPETLILRLTATATSSVIADIQKILSIESCTQRLFRSNLKYMIEGTDPKMEDIIERIAKLLKTKYLNESGIIYCLTIKNFEEVTQKLKTLGLKADSYDAQIDSQLRSSVHQKWYQNRCF
jgi:ATP-dependent DNA helicase Q1